MQLSLHCDTPTQVQKTPGWREAKCCFALFLPLQYLGNIISNILSHLFTQIHPQCRLWLAVARTHLPLSGPGQPAAGSRLKIKAPWASYTFPILPFQWPCTFCLHAHSLACIPKSGMFLLNSIYFLPVLIKARGGQVSGEHPFMLWL